MTYDKPTSQEIRKVMNFVEMERCDNIFSFDGIKKNSYSLAVSVLSELFWQAREEEKQAKEEEKEAIQ